MLKYVTMLIAHNLQGYIVQVSTLQKWAVQKNRYKMQTKTEKTNTAHSLHTKQIQNIVWWKNSILLLANVK